MLVTKWIIFILICYLSALKSPKIDKNEAFIATLLHISKLFYNLLTNSFIEKYPDLDKVKHRWNAWHGTSHL